MDKNGEVYYESQHYLYSLGQSMAHTPSAGFCRNKGKPSLPNLFGRVLFYEHPYGVLMVAEVEGLPNPEGACASPIFALHIHQGSSCTGDGRDHFGDTGMHYNPKDCPHPHHAGDLHPLFGTSGYSFSACLTDRFTLGGDY